MTSHPIVSKAEWMAARRELMEREKELTRQRDEVSRLRRALPWTPVTKEYRFQSPDGIETLADLFDGRSQLLVYHFMFDTSWDQGCKSCSFWADNYERVDIHLAHRDVTLLTVSTAPIETLEAYKKRMGWTFKWVSSGRTDFNRDFGVSPPSEGAQSKWYNFETSAFPAAEAPGVSVFYRNEDGAIYRTYSCYSRGLDALNGAYQLLDLVPKGRDEAGLPNTMAWLRHRDRYES